MLIIQAILHPNPNPILTIHNNIQYDVCISRILMIVIEINSLVLVSVYRAIICWLRLRTSLQVEAYTDKYK